MTRFEPNWIKFVSKDHNDSFYLCLCAGIQASAPKAINFQPLSARRIGGAAAARIAFIRAICG